jgi:hypothetical protein
LPSRDIEQSLREEIEGYVQGRVAGLREEIARLQDQLNQGFARLNDRVESDAQSDAPVAVAVADHLRQARNRGIEEAAEGSSRARSSGDVAIIKAAVEDLGEQQSQSEALNALVNRAASFAPRIAFFVVRNERVTGWRARGLEGTVGDDAVREISLPLDSDTLLGEAARSQRSWSGAPGSHGDDNSIYTHFGGDPPHRIVAIPLTVRGKSVAVLYADSAGQDAEAVNLEALETLVRVTGMAVELIASRSKQQGRPAQAEAATHEAAPAETAEGQPEAERAEPAQAVEREHEAAEPERVEEPEFVAAHSEPAPAAEPAPAYDYAPAEIVSEPEPADSGWMGRAGLAAEPAEVAQQPAQADASPRRRYGADSELPVDVSAEERPVHDKARRFARLLVSEIKLYNEQKVREGREAGDLYGRLREDIDRSREMYDKRFGEQVNGRYDYFHHELVNTLADGDAARLGHGYPGAG